MTTRTYLDNKNFFKPNYYKAIEYIVPKYLLDDDLESSGKKTDYTDQLINSHIEFASSISSTLNISAIANTAFSSISSINGISNYFVKQNGLTNISPRSFKESILDKLGKSFNDFDSATEFAEYLNSDLLPSIRLNYPSADFVDGAVSGNHLYLIQHLSWIYFLNTSGSVLHPSSIVSDLLVDKLYSGESIQINDGIKALTKYIWYNYPQYIPTDFVSSTGVYTSGTQQLDKLLTWVDIVYSPLYADRSDYIVRDRFEQFINSNILTENKVIDGAFTKLVRALSLLSFDINSKVEELESLADINNCPDDYLPFLADLIGWKLFGSNPSRWRLQLINAVDVYKKAGTKESIQFALNTVFPKDQFDIESRVTELWESYIPYLIFYSLATESSYFSSTNSWTRSIATHMGIESYSVSSLDENIKLATDKILLETYLKFPQSFHLPYSEYGYLYRNRVYQIPPFEEYPYYVNTELTIEILNFIADRLVCFGVSNDFALAFRDYVKENTIDVDDYIRNNSFLFFTSGYNQAPNFSSLFLNYGNKKLEYASLWSGKSSHFSVNFEASDFDYTNLNEDDITSFDALKIASKVINEFAPAHAIPMISLELSGIDSISSVDSILPIYDIIKAEHLDTTKILSNYAVSGLMFTQPFKRNDFGSNQHPMVTGATVSGNLPRRSIRKRDYGYVLTNERYYDRTGFNMPISWSMVSSLSGIPLGFIPSSLSYEDIPDYNNIPLIYSVCYNENSNESKYGYAISSTLKCRGNEDLSAIDSYCDRGQVPDIFITMHEIGEGLKYLYQVANLSSTLLEQEWKDVYTSEANRLTESSGLFPELFSDYTNFSFGRDLHLLYRQYTSNFDRHRLSEDVITLDGPNIFSHTYGPTLYNSKFDTLGSNGETYLTSSLGDIRLIAGSSVGYSVVSGEYVNSSIVDSVDLVIPSGISLDNAFALFKFYNSTLSNFDDYMLSKYFLGIKATNGMPRLKFQLRLPTLSDKYPISKNFLVPECTHKLSIKSVITDNLANSFGGRSVGVWIHTNPESGYMWSYTPNGWISHSPELTKAELLDSYANIIRVDEYQREITESTEELTESTLKCLDLGTSESTSIKPPLNLAESDFKTISIEFDTSNRKLIYPLDYQYANSHLHRLDQEYVIEVFLLPNQQSNKFLLLDSVSIQNLTLNNLSKIVAVSGCPEYRLALTQEQVLSIFKFWNDISGKNSALGLASRVASETSTIMGNNGGSRLDYRTNYTWQSVTYAFTNGIVEQTEINI